MDDRGRRSDRFRFFLVQVNFRQLNFGSLLHCLLYCGLHWLFGVEHSTPSALVLSLARDHWRDEQFFLDLGLLHPRSFPLLALRQGGQMLRLAIDLSEAFGLFLEGGIQHMVWELLLWQRLVLQEGQSVFILVFLFFFLQSSLLLYELGVPHCLSEPIVGE